MNSVLEINKKVPYVEVVLTFGKGCSGKIKFKNFNFNFFYEFFFDYKKEVLESDIFGNQNLKKEKIRNKKTKIKNTSFTFQIKKFFYFFFFFFLWKKSFKMFFFLISKMNQLENDEQNVFWDGKFVLRIESLLKLEHSINEITKRFGEAIVRFFAPFQKKNQFTRQFFGEMIG